MAVNQWQLSFSERFDYGPHGDILFPLVLSSDLSNRVLVRAKLDTGSDVCVFQKHYAEMLGLQAERVLTNSLEQHQPFRSA
jgi:hypothetical protein